MLTTACIVVGEFALSGYGRSTEIGVGGAAGTTYPQIISILGLLPFLMTKVRFYRLLVPATADRAYTATLSAPPHLRQREAARCSVNVLSCSWSFPTTVIPQASFLPAIHQFSHLVHPLHTIPPLRTFVPHSHPQIHTDHHHGTFQTARPKPQPRPHHHKLIHAFIRLR